jgi:predicted neuraminidase
MKLEHLSRRLLVPTDHDLFGNCHASTLTLLPGGRRLAAFFAGTREGAGDTAIWLAESDGTDWRPPVRTVAEPGLAHWNPVLLAEGDDVRLFYKVGADVHHWTTRIVRSPDGGRSWSPPEPLVAGDTAPRGPVKNKPVVLADGTWLAGGSIESDRAWDAFADLSTDRGRSWTRVEVPFVHHAGGGITAGADVWNGLAEDALWESDPGRAFTWDGVIQPTVWESRPGSVHMLLRSTRGRIYRSDSTDAGRSWSVARPTRLPNNNSGIDLVRLDDGRLVLAFNPVSGNWSRRTPLSLTVSEDDGESWSPPFDLEDRPGEFSYPAIVADGRRIHVTYTADRRTIVAEVLEIEPVAASPVTTARP